MNWGMIDHPRLALQTRGSMELWIPNEAKIPGDLTRWWSLLGEEVSLHTLNPSEQMSLIGALDSMIERIESNEYLKVAWEQEVEEKSNRDELTIVNKLGLGVRFRNILHSQECGSQWNKIQIKAGASRKICYFLVSQ